jgi:hypothetical protein
MILTLPQEFIDGMEDIPESSKEQFDALVAEAIKAHAELPAEVFSAGLSRFKPTVQSYILAQLMFGEPF